MDKSGRFSTPQTIDSDLDRMGVLHPVTVQGAVTPEIQATLQELGRAGEGSLNAGQGCQVGPADQVPGQAVAFLD